MAFSRAEYENLLYALTNRYAEVTASTLRLYSNSATTAFVRGVVQFRNGLELRVFEYLDLTDGELLDYMKCFAAMKRFVGTIRNPIPKTLW